MKLLNFVLGLMLVSGVTFAMEAERLPQAGLVTGDAVTVTDGATDFTVGRASSCEASTVCANGRQLACVASGIRTRCQRVSGRAIACEAWGSKGSYSSAVDRCY